MAANADVGHCTGMNQLLLAVLIAVPLQSNYFGPLDVALVGEPESGRTVALLEMLRTRFPEARLVPPIWGQQAMRDADVVVLDGDQSASPRGVRMWKAYQDDGLRPWAASVTIGGAIPTTCGEWNLLGHQGVVPQFGAVEHHGPQDIVHTGASGAELMLDAATFGSGHAALAFDLLEAPDVEVALGTRDALGRPLALVWHQGKHFAFGPGGHPDDLGDAWQHALLSCVEYAAAFERTSRGSERSPPHPGSNALGELRWLLAQPTLDLDRARSLIAPELAEVVPDAAAFVTWYRDHSHALVGDERGLLNLDPDLFELGLAAKDDAFIEHAIASLEDPNIEVRGRSRRLLERHMEGGPGGAASHAEWRSWHEEYGSTLLFTPSDQRWRRDWSARRLGVDPRSLLPGERATRQPRPNTLPGAAPRPSFALALFDNPTGAQARHLPRANGAALAEPLWEWWTALEDAVARRGGLGTIACLGPQADALVERVHAEVALDPSLAAAALDVYAAAGPQHLNLWLEASRLAEATAQDGGAGVPIPTQTQRLLSGTLRQMARHPQMAESDFVRIADELMAAFEEGAPLRSLALVSSLGERGAQPTDAWLAPLKTILRSPRDRRFTTHQQSQLRTLALRALGQLRSERSLDLLISLVEGSTASASDSLLRTRALLTHGESGLRTLLAQRATAEDAEGLEARAAWMGAKDPRELLAPGDGRTPHELRVTLLALPVAWSDAEALGRPFPLDSVRELLAELALGDDESTAMLAVHSLGWMCAKDRRAAIHLAAALAHPSPWRRRAAAHELGSPYRDVRAAREALLAATADGDPWVTLLATWALREPQGTADDSLVNALRATERKEGTLAQVARHAREHHNRAAGWYIESWRIMAPKMQARADLVHLDHPVEEKRWEAARDLAASEAVLEWLTALESSDDRERALANEHIARIEHELAAWVSDLVMRMQGEYFGGGPVTAQVGSLGRMAVPQVCRDFMAAPRMPIGPNATYETHVEVFEKVGAEAWPALLESIWHWRDHGMTDARAAWRNAGGAAEILAPFLAMRLARDAGYAPGSASTADPRNEQHLAEYWKPIFDALGEFGRSALTELGAYPDLHVREAADALLQ